MKTFQQGVERSVLHAALSSLCQRGKMESLLWLGEVVPFGSSDRSHGFAEGLECCGPILTTNKCFPHTSYIVDGSTSLSHKQRDDQASSRLGTMLGDSTGEPMYRGEYPSRLASNYSVVYSRGPLYRARFFCVRLSPRGLRLPGFTLLADRKN